MRSYRLLAAILALALLPTACARGEDPPAEVTTPSTEIVVEKSKRDVTICVVPGPMPDLMSTRVKANGKQRVCWKGHGQAYEIRFANAVWPFEEPSPYDTTGGWSRLRAPADSAGDFYSLKEPIPAGETRTYKYEIVLPGAADSAPPPGTGPEIVGEG